MNSKDAAVDLIKYYVLRGDSLGHLRTSWLGSHNDEYSASIYGNAWDENDKLVHKGTNNEIVVTRIGKKPCCHVFKLDKIFNEIKSGQMKLL